MAEIIASDLKDVLNRLSSILTSKGLIENADKFVFNKDTIHVFNGETFIMANFESDVCGGVEGLSLLKYVEKLSTSKVEIEQGEGKIDLKKGKSIASFIVEEMADLPLDLSDIKWHTAPTNFIPALNACSYTCGQDYTDMRLVVVHVCGTTAESTDQERITRYKLDRRMKDEFFIPAEIVPYLAKAKIVHYAKTEDWMLFENQSGDIICHRNIRLGEEYINLQEIVEKCSEGKPLELPDKMYDAVEKAAIFQSDVKIDSDRKITVRCKGQKIRIESNGTHGNFLEILPCDIEENFMFTVNPAFLTQIMEKSNTVYFHSDYMRIETDDYVFLTTLASE